MEEELKVITEKYVVLREDYFNNIVEMLNKKSRIKTWLLIGTAGYFVYRRIKRLRSYERENRLLREENERLYVQLGDNSEQ